MCVERSVPGPPPNPQVAIFEPDPLFLVHHGLCICVWTDVLWSGRGNAMPLLFLAGGEATSPLNNMWWLAKKAGVWCWVVGDRRRP